MMMQYEVIEGVARVNTPRDRTDPSSINESKPVVIVFRDPVIKDTFLLTEGQYERAVFGPALSHEVESFFVVLFSKYFIS